MGLHPKIVSQDVEALFPNSGHGVWLLRRYSAGELEALHERVRQHLFQHLLFGRIHESDCPAHRSLRTDVARERTSVEIGDSRDAVLLQIGVEASFGAPVGVEPRGFANDEARDLRDRRFTVLGVDAVVADERVGHGDQLARVRRVRQDLLIPRHTGVEDYLTQREIRRAHEVTVEAATVF